MDIITLASGSEGNCTVIRSKEAVIVVDMGISCRRTTNFLKEVGIEPHEISAIFVTHEHSDHISGIRVFSKKYNTRVAAIKEVWTHNHIDVQQELRVNLKRRMRINDLEIEAFETAHDTIYPVGFTFYDGKQKVGVATDTGYVTQAMLECLEDLDALVIEANHDEKMLRDGNYPYFLKQRILSKQGHLSNNDCGDFLVQKAVKGTKIILAHLSDENNSPSVALKTVHKKFSSSNKDDFCEIFVAPRLGVASY